MMSAHARCRSAAARPASGRAQQGFERIPIDVDQLVEVAQRGVQVRGGQTHAVLWRGILSAVPAAMDHRRVHRRRPCQPPPGERHAQQQGRVDRHGYQRESKPQVMHSGLTQHGRNGNGAAGRVYAAQGKHQGQRQSCCQSGGGGRWPQPPKHRDTHEG
jgi:hypothetical protein